MTTVSLRSVELDGFKRYRDRAVLALADRPAGLHFVRGENHLNIARMGSNGAGKSSLWDAVCWCLYGKTVKGRPTSAVRPWRSKKQPCVSLAIRRGDTDHVVQRGPRATQLTLDGKAVGQEEVEALVGFSHAEFTQAVVLGQGRPLFLDLRPAEKMQLLSDVLGLERWERRAATAGERSKRLEAQLAEAVGELRGVEASMEHAENTLRDAQSASESWGRERQARLDALEEALSAARSELEGLEKQEAETSLAADAVGLRLRDVRPAIEEARRARRGQERTAAEHEHKRQRLAEERAELSGRIVQFGEEGTCPLCGQAVAKKDADRHVREARARLKHIDKEMVEAQARGREASDAVRTLDEQIADGEEQLGALEVEERSHQSTLRSLGRGLGTARGRVSSLSEQLATAGEEVNPHREAAAAARRRIRELQRDEEELSREAEKLEASAERAKFWVRGFRDIRLMIIDDVLGDLQETTAAMLEALGMGEWEVAYATERETKSGTTQRALHVAVTSPESGEPRDWEDWSGGEGQRLRLAGALALSEVLLAHAGVQVDVRVLDEPTRSLSAEGVRDLCELLADYAEDADLRLFYVDHMAQESAHFASTTTVVNDAGGAHIQT